MVSDLLLALTFVGLALTAVLHCSQRSALRRGRTPSAPAAVPISVLKPLKGVDEDLEGNLRTFFELDYPCFELVFGVQDEADPALAVVRRMTERHPGVPASVVVSPAAVGHNPKVNNLAGMAGRARHDWLLISDSNVAVKRDYLWHMVTPVADPRVGMVTSLIRAVGGCGLGGTLEAVQLNTFVMGGVAAVSGLLRQVCAVGKSMLVHRRVLDAIGGFEKLGRYLAEDQVCGEAVRAAGRLVVVSPAPVDNVLGRFGLAGFASRHLRWARIRRAINLPGYLGELLTNPVAPALANLVIFPGRASLAVMVATVLALSLLASASERALEVRRNPLLYPPLELLRGLLLLALWPVPFVSRTVCWRGHRYRIGHRTLLAPIPGDDATSQPWSLTEDDDVSAEALA